MTSFVTFALFVGQLIKNLKTINLLKRKTFNPRDLENDSITLVHCQPTYLEDLPSSSERSKVMYQPNTGTQLKHYLFV